MRLRKFYENRKGAGFIAAVVMLIGVLMAAIIGAIVFFAFADGVASGNDAGNLTNADNVTNSVVTYAITVFALLAIVPLILVGGLMLRSLGFMGGGEAF